MAWLSDNKYCKLSLVVLILNFRICLSMHELSLACGLLGEAEEVMTREGAAKVLSITVSIGEMSGVDRESFESAFQIASETVSTMPGVRLIVELEPVRVKCSACGVVAPVKLPVVLCSACGAGEIEVVSGRDFLIKSMEVE